MCAHNDIHLLSHGPCCNSNIEYMNMTSFTKSSPFISYLLNMPDQHDWRCLWVCCRRQHFVFAWQHDFCEFDFGLNILLRHRKGASQQQLTTDWVSFWKAVFSGSTAELNDLYVRDLINADCQQWLLRSWSTMDHQKFWIQHWSFEIWVWRQQLPSTAPSRIQHSQNHTGSKLNNCRLINKYGGWQQHPRSTRQWLINKE